MRDKPQQSEEKSLAKVEERTEVKVRGLFGSGMLLDDLRAAWLDYQKLRETLTTDDDYVYFLRYPGGRPESYVSREVAEKVRAEKAKIAPKKAPVLERRIKKSGVYKIKTAMELIRGENFSTRIIGSRDNLDAWSEGKARHLYFSYTVGLFNKAGECLEQEVASCSTSERGFTHLPHDIQTTALTRASIRVIMKHFGFGEVAAEELMPTGSALLSPIPGEIIDVETKEAEAESRRAKEPEKKPKAAKVAKGETKAAKKEKEGKPERAARKKVKEEKQEKKSDETEKSVEEGTTEATPGEPSDPSDYLGQPSREEQEQRLAEIQQFRETLSVEDLRRIRDEMCEELGLPKDTSVIQGLSNLGFDEFLRRVGAASLQEPPFRVEGV